jgi:hypothetical protein
MYDSKEMVMDTNGRVMVYAEPTPERQVELNGQGLHNGVDYIRIICKKLNCVVTVPLQSAITDEMIKAIENGEPKEMLPVCIPSSSDILAVPYSEIDHGIIPELVETEGYRLLPVKVENSIDSNGNNVSHTVLTVQISKEVGNVVLNDLLKAMERNESSMVIDFYGVKKEIERKNKPVDINLNTDSYKPTYNEITQEYSPESNYNNSFKDNGISI